MAKGNSKKGGRNFMGLLKSTKQLNISRLQQVFLILLVLYITPPPQLNVNIKTVTDFVQYKFIKLFSLHNLKVQSLDINSKNKE